MGSPLSVGLTPHTNKANHPKDSYCSHMPREPQMQRQQYITVHRYSGKSAGE